MTDCISKILGIKDKNIKFEDTLDEKVYKGMTCLFFYGELSYTPPRWALCGYKNKDYSIVKNGKKQSCITLNKMNERPAYLVLAKQRFYCKCCESHFTAKTNVVDMYCYIANSTKLAIVDKATEVRSEKAIARDTSVSPTTVSRYIDMIANQIQSYTKELQQMV